jgi:hypothetical protein
MWKRIFHTSQTYRSAFGKRSHETSRLSSSKHEQVDFGIMYAGGRKWSLHLRWGSTVFGPTRFSPRLFLVFSRPGPSVQPIFRFILLLSTRQTSLSDVRRTVPQDFGGRGGMYEEQWCSRCGESTSRQCSIFFFCKRLRLEEILSKLIVHVLWSAWASVLDLGPWC